MKRISSTDKAYQRIKQQILSCKLKPGERLTSRAMAKIAGVSIIPVIHALQRLENEGLVETQQGWGSRVIQLDQSTIRDRFWLREAIECQIVRILSSTLTHHQALELTQFTRQLDLYGCAETVDERYWAADHEFHLMLAKFSGSKTLLQEIQKINLFRILQGAREYMLTQHESFPPDHHMRIVEAILTHNPDHAEKVMRDHLYHRSHGPLKAIEIISKS